MSGFCSLSFSQACQMFFCLPPTVASSSSSCGLSAQPGFLWLPPPLLAPFCLQKKVSGLDNGVPIKVILDVISWHAMHLEVSGRYHVLLVHLCMVSWRKNRGEEESDPPSFLLFIGKFLLIKTVNIKIS